MFFHHSAELYGSDKTLLLLAGNLDPERYSACVILPETGPLEDALAEQNVETHVLPLARLSRATYGVSGLLRLTRDVYVSLKEITRVLGDRNVDLVHSNTLAVLSGAIWAKTKSVPHIWHVHEMIVHPALVRKTLPFVANRLSSFVVCNSTATRDLLVSCEQGLNGKTKVIWNGLDRNNQVDPLKASMLRTVAGLEPCDILVVLMGRVNRWKGQLLLIDAADKLWERGFRNITYLIVGSAPKGQEHFERALAERLTTAKVAERVKIQGFTRDVWPIWDACDIAVVPSTEPEPFGMVALEAMAAGRPVVAAGHGGLLDIVLNGQTGIVFEPGSAESLADAIQKLAVNHELRDQMGKAGRARWLRYFTTQKYVDAFEELYASICAA